MKCNDAKRLFQQALDGQKTITISKLKKLMQSMNMTTKSKNVLVTRRKNGKPTIIHFEGRRFIHQGKRKG